MLESEGAVVRPIDLAGNLVKCFILFIIEANDFCDQQNSEKFQKAKSRILLA